MSRPSTKIKSVKITGRARRSYARRDRSLDHAEVPQLPPEVWANGVIGKYYRPLKSQISLRVDNDVLTWLRSKGPGHLSRINTILRDEMTRERRG